MFLQAYPFVEPLAGASNIFFGYGVISISFGLIAYFVVPETKGRSLEDIQEYFESIRKKPTPTEKA